MNKVNRIIYCIIDDVRSEHFFQYIDKGLLPNFKKLMENGIYSKTCITDFPSVTYPTQPTLITGTYTGNYKKFSRISVGVNAYLHPVLRAAIPRTSFYPVPKIDLSLVKLIPKEDLQTFLIERESAKFFLKFIAGIMPYKNKNLVNALFLYFKVNREYNYNKSEIFQIIKEKGFDNKRLFNFKIDEIIRKNLHQSFQYYFRTTISLPKR